MSISIRTNMANGAQRFEHYDSEADGLRALEVAMDEQRAAGNTVTQVGDIYSVTDRSGVVVQQSVVSRSL